jgi:hypothetical protein
MALRHASNYTVKPFFAHQTVTNRLVGGEADGFKGEV